MGEKALKSHAAGKKHITVVTQTQKTDSVADFFTVKCGATPGASSSAGLENHPYHWSVILKKQRFRKCGNTWESYDKVCLKEKTTQS